MAAQAKKAPASKAEAKKAAAKAPAAKKPATKSAAVKKAATKTSAPKKDAGKKVVAKKAAAKAEVAKKTAPKAAAKKQTAQKPVAKKAAAKAPAAKAPAAKAPAAKAPAAKAPAAKTTGFKAQVAKPAAAPKKEGAKKVAASKPEAKKVAPKAAEKKPAEKKVEAQKPEVKKPLPKQKDGFKIKDYIVYPTHGVGQIIDIEESEVAGMSLQLFVIYFDQEKMTLRVPLAKATSTGMRALSSSAELEKALSTLKGRARIKRTMWSRRAQEYEAKINSGDIHAISEVVRDLYRAEGQPEQSYSERQLYEQALDRMTREVAAVDKSEYSVALVRLESYLRKEAPKAAANDEDGDADPQATAAE